MENHRIYGSNVNIDSSRTKNFYDDRADKLETMENPYVSVLLGDQNPEYAVLWNQFEKEHILPKLAIDSESCVLDIGCGMGRWAETLIPMSKYYCGTDISAKMLEQARKRNAVPNKEYDFLHHSFEEFCRLPANEIKYKFNRLVMCGVFMYINDDVIERGLKALCDKLDSKVKVYFTETIALKERLTLKQFYSTALKAEYDVIYRTEEEYNRFYEEWIKNGFKIKEQGLLPHLNKENEYRETDRWYTILERE